MAPATLLYLIWCKVQAVALDDAEIEEPAADMPAPGHIRELLHLSPAKLAAEPAAKLAAELGATGL